MDRWKDRMWTETHDELGRPVTQRRGDRSATSIAYDEFGHVLAYTQTPEVGKKPIQVGNGWDRNDRLVDVFDGKPHKVDDGCNGHEGGQRP